MGGKQQRIGWCVIFLHSDFGEEVRKMSMLTTLCLARWLPSIVVYIWSDNDTVPDVSNRIARLLVKPGGGQMQYIEHPILDTNWRSSRHILNGLGNICQNHYRSIHCEIANMSRRTFAHALKETIGTTRL